MPQDETASQLAAAECPELGLVTRLQLLEEQLAAQGAPVARALQPGLSHGEVAALARDKGLTFPRELREWYVWHDGVAGEEDAEHYVDVGLGNAMVPLTWAEAALHYDTLTSAESQVATGKTYHWYWWPITYFIGGINLVVDIRGDDGEPCPVHKVDGRGDRSGDWEEARAPSMTAMVALWNRALSEQWWRWDHDEWADTYAAMPEDLADTELV
ncbi:MAG: hypothetical protein QOG52_2614 [Frankiaceae bacterium]|jgi:hypothetical protein|nr:hypothetical protein [Frankiaceae bacterium]